jgi:hypothetical protein
MNQKEIQKRVLAIDLQFFRDNPEAQSYIRALIPGEEPEQRLRDWEFYGNNAKPVAVKIHRLRRSNAVGKEPLFPASDNCRTNLSVVTLRTSPALSALIDELDVRPAAADHILNQEEDDGRVHQPERGD